MSALTSPQPAETFEPRESIWAYIEKQTLEEERLEIKKLIGSSLIEETVDLHQEVILSFFIKVIVPLSIRSLNSCYYFKKVDINMIKNFRLIHCSRFGGNAEKGMMIKGMVRKL